MKIFIVISVLILVLLSSFSAFGEDKNKFKEQDFTGKFILTDPACSYNTYHGEIILSSDGKGRSKEYVDNKIFEPGYNDLVDKDGYVPLKWSFDEKRKELIIDWTINGKYDKLAYFKSKVKGDINNFTIKGFAWDGAVSELNFTRIEGDFTKPVTVTEIKLQNFMGLFDITNPEDSTYHGEVILLDNGNGKVREYINNKPFLPAYPELLDKDGYLPLKWSFNKETMEFTFDWTCDGKYKGLGYFKSKVAGNINSFTLDGTLANGAAGKLHFIRVEKKKK